MSAPEPPSVFLARRGERRPGAGRTSYVALGSETAGDFGLFESDLPPGAGGPGPHYHEGFSESFYVLEGELLLLGPGAPTVAAAGDFAHVPRGAVHGFRNARDDAPCRFLILFAPGVAREAYFEGLAALLARDPAPSTEEIDAFARRHDQVNLR